MTPISPPVRADGRRLHDWGRPALLAVLALAGILLVLSNTRWGAYLSDDSYYYLYPARDFAAGKGFSPSYIFAPMLPLILAVISMLGIEALVAIRWLNALLFGVNILLAAHLVWATTRKPAFAILAAALVLLADVVVEAHGWAMSEALAFTFMLLGLNACLLYLTSARQGYLWAAVLSAALTVLTRYAALPIIATIALTLLIHAPHKSWLMRVRVAVLFGLASLLPIAAYWLRNQLTSGHPVRYQQFLNVPFDRSQLTWFCYHWFSLFIPGRLLREREILAGGVISLIALLVVAGLAWRYRRALAATSTPAFRAGTFLCSAFLALNLLMLYLARGLTELDVFNPRYLVPMLIVFLVLACCLAGQLWPLAGRWVRGSLVVFLAIFLVYYGYRTVEFSRQMARMGLGYSNVGWHNSETVAYLHQHPELTHLVSTGEMGIYFWTGRMPQVISAFPGPNQLQTYLCQNDAILLLMDQMPADLYGMTRDQAIQGLQLAQRFNDSEMYRCPSAPQ